MPGTDMSLEQLKIYQGSYPAPVDFEFHWEEVKRKLEAYTFKPEEEVVRFAGSKLRYSRITITAPDGTLLRAKYIRPQEGEQPRKYPLVVQFHDYPQASRSWFHLSRYAAVGYAVLAPDCRGQGGCSEAGEPGKGATGFGPMFFGLQDRVEKLYLHKIIEDALLWILAGKLLTETEKEKIVVYGEGQGAGLALSTAALFSEIGLCGAHYPMLCDYYRVWEKDFDINAYEGLRYYFRWKDPLHEREKEVFDKLAYVDVKNFAPMIRGKVLMSTGLQDVVSPPSAQFAVFNGLQCEKRHLVYPKHGHELINFFENEWLNCLIPG
ncbi:MAG: acetylxylan esterase [Lachnospiraceae bacterium]|nr:acetylxylan esterase [Lachnospiraceae bacterium]